MHRLQMAPWAAGAQLEGRFRKLPHLEAIPEVGWTFSPQPEASAQAPAARTEPPGLRVTLPDPVQPG